MPYFISYVHHAPTIKKARITVVVVVVLLPLSCYLFSSCESLDIIDYTIHRPRHKTMVNTLPNTTMDRRGGRRQEERGEDIRQGKGWNKQREESEGGGLYYQGQ